MPGSRKAITKSKSTAIVVTANYQDYLPFTPVFPLSEEFSYPKRTFPSADDFYTIIENYTPYEQQADIDLWKDVGLMVFTSGTTGRPKGAMLTYGSALFKTAASTASDIIAWAKDHMAAYKYTVRRLGQCR
ncbi:AMP-binding protein [Peribacillus cavernae]|uniref:AMP-binding protein n=1 Tax=Peribacillus cavernae TaxID=1674310 RepID=UPI001FEC6977|nr:AMP-binding protein [Peribacillus cavernae]MDQ0217767.1 acyl-coenzyme A synthetase/AMP-(fatty) acid ligase [Peribacillus cavernae]